MTRKEKELIEKNLKRLHERIDITNDLLIAFIESFQNGSLDMEYFTKEIQDINIKNHSNGILNRIIIDL